MISNTGSTPLVYFTEHMLVKVYKDRGPRKRFQSACGMRLEAYYPSTWERMEHFHAGINEHVLVPMYLLSIPEVQAKLACGAEVADIGYGHGRAELSQQSSLLEA